MTKDLDELVYPRIGDLCKLGDELAEKGDFANALGKYVEALSLVPDPVLDWEASTWILTAIGDVYFHVGDYRQSRAALEHAMRAPNAIGNPFIHLRLGQVQFELGEMERARDELARAYMGAGDEIFAEEDPKYLDLIRSLMRQG